MAAGEPPAGDAAFFEVELETFERCPATPEMDATEVGIRIAAPGRVVAAGRATRIPVCAVVGYDAALGAEFPTEFWSGLVAVAIDVDGERAEAAPLADPGSPVDLPEETEGEPAAELPFESVVYERCYNFDLASYLRLPVAPGTFNVFLTTGRTHSNTVRIRVEPPPRPPR